MPVYPFECPKCSEKYEFVTSVTEYVKICQNVPCPKCKIPMRRIYTTFAIHGLGYDMGYRPDVDDPVKEIKWDMKKLEQKATETHNLKKYRETKEALKNFEEANSDILK